MPEKLNKTSKKWFLFETWWGGGQKKKWKKKSQELNQQPIDYYSSVLSTRPQSLIEGNVPYLLYELWASARRSFSLIISLIGNFWVFIFWSLDLPMILVRLIHERSWAEVCRYNFQNEPILWSKSHFLEDHSSQTKWFETKRHISPDGFGSCQQV